MPAASAKSASCEPAQKRAKSNTGTAVTTKNVPTTTSSNAQTVEVASAPKSILTGNFDLYDMRLSFLKGPYLAKAAATPDYGALYAAILPVQAKPDRTAQIYLPGVDSTSDGHFKSIMYEDKMEDMPYPIAITSLARTDAPLKFTATELANFATPDYKPPQAQNGGVSGQTRLIDSHCGISSAGGVFKMTGPVWSTTDATSGQVKEIFEGVASFKTVHSGMYARKGHGKGAYALFPFWAVRAKKDAAGKEAGIGPLKGTPALHGGGMPAASVYDDILDDEEEEDELEDYGHGPGIYGRRSYNDSDEDY